MRDLLTGFAIALILLLFAALVVPLAVDWNGFRGQIESALGRTLGASVSTRGDISVRLLPSPQLELGGLSLARPDGGTSLSVGRSRVELAVSPLLSGELRVTAASLENPVLTITTTADGELLLPEFAAATPAPLPQVERLVLDKLTIINGALVLREAGASGAPVRRLRLGRLNGEFQGSLPGSWQLHGAVEGQPFGLSAGTGSTPENSRLKGWLGNALVGRVEVDGLVAGERHASGATTPRFTGRVQATRPLGGAQPNSGELPKLELRAEAVLMGAALDIDTLELSLVQPGEALKLSGRGSARLMGVDGAGPGARLELGAARIDAARALDQLAPLLRGAWADEDIALLALPLDVQLSVAALAWGGEEATDARAVLRVADGRIDVSALSARLPGEGDVRASGTVRLDDEPGASLRVGARVAEPARLALSLGRLGLPEAWGRRLVRQDTLSFEADLALSPSVAAARNMRLAAGPATVAGVVRYSFGGDEVEAAVGGAAQGVAPLAGRLGDASVAGPDGRAARPRLDAQLTAERLDLAELPALSEVVHVAGGADLGLLIDARDVRYGTDAGAGRVRARLSREDGRLAIETLDISDLSGARVEAKGSLDPRGDGRITAHVTAERAGVVLGLAGKLMGAGALDRLPEGVRAAPLRLTAAGDSSGSGAGRRLGITLNGTLGSSTLTGQIALGGEDNALRDADVALVDPDAADLLARWGVPLAGKPALGPADLVLTVKPAASGAVAGADALQARLGGRIAGLELRTESPLLLGVQGAVLPGNAALHATAADVAPLATSFGFGSGGAMPFELSLSSQTLAGTRSAGSDRADALSGWRFALAGKLAQVPFSGDLALAEDAPARLRLDLAQASLPALAALTVLGPLPEAASGSFWPSQRFAPLPEGLSGWLSTALAAPAGGGGGGIEVVLAARRLELGAGYGIDDASLQMRPLTEGMSFVLDKGTLAGGGVSGAMTLRRNGSSVGFSTQLRLDGVRLQALAPAHSGAGQPVSGALSGQLNIGGAGESIAAIVANLSGGGALKAADARLGGLDPKALVQLVAAGITEAGQPAADTQSLDARVLRTRAEPLLAGGALDIGSIEVPVVVTGGVVRAMPLSARLPQVALNGGVAVDVKTLTIDASLALSQVQAPAGWKGASPQLRLSWSGPLAAPSREIDTAGLATGLAAIRLGKELERIEAFEAEARRLKAERDKQEAEARAAAEARRQREAEEARLRDIEARKRESEARPRDDQPRRDGVDQPPAPPPRPRLPEPESRVPAPGQPLDIRPR